MPCSTYSLNNLDTLNTQKRQNTLWRGQKVGMFQRLASQVVKAFCKIIYDIIYIQVLLKTYALEFKKL